jgi:guanine deaminase
MDNTIFPENAHPSETSHTGSGLDDHAYLVIATQIATENVLSGKGGPFGAVIVAPDGRIFAKGNSVTSTNDPTAHAEVNAIRFACQELGTFDLSGCVLYSSCEPCPMCLGAAMWSRVERVAFAADRHDAAAAGFDDAVFYEKLAAEENDFAEQHVFDNYKKPFEVWETFGNRTEY